jgi:hypothetical protein
MQQALSAGASYGSALKDYFKTLCDCINAHVGRMTDVVPEWQRELMTYRAYNGWELTGTIEHMHDSRLVLQTVINEIDDEVDDDELEMACFVLDRTLPLVDTAHNKERFMRTLVCSALVLARKMRSQDTGVGLHSYASQMGMPMYGYLACERLMLQQMDWFFPRVLAVDCLYVLSQSNGWDWEDKRVMDASFYIAEFHIYGWAWFHDDRCTSQMALAISALELTFKEAGTPLAAELLQSMANLCCNEGEFERARESMRAMLE